MTLRRRPDARWEASAPPDAAAAEALASALSIPPTLAQLLVARGHGAEAGAKRFLRPDLDQLHEPGLMAGMADAVDRLSRAVRDGEMIVVHGDYDVDGMCSTALLTRTLRGLGARVTPFIPDRTRDGYDLGPAGVEAARSVGAGLVLTCDCGTTAVQAGRDLAAAGIDLIISDHHLPGPELPQAVAILNPRRVDDTSPDKDLAAVGVAFKLATALTTALGGNQNVVLNQLDLVALATVADVAPLRGENRVFVRRGLALMRETKNLGLRALIRSSGLDGKEITVGRVGFILAPRLNALGRIDSALLGVDLLLTERDDEALSIARHCEERNRERQELDRTILDGVLRRVDALDADSTWGIALADTSWHPGVIGIVASRVVEQTGRPAFLVAVNDGVGKGSGRSIPAFDLHAALTSCAELLVKYGGHRAAAGLTIEPSRMDEFAERFNEVARERLTADDLMRVVRVDLELPLANATVEMERALRHFEPFGVGNPGPTFSARGVRLATSATRIGADGVKCMVDAPGGPIEAVGWGLAPRASVLRAGATVDLAYKLERNTFRGADRLQLGIVDFRPAA
ncbi:MAG: single-stranded-DNA-specific exonuclease RecJ [Gemmatimonadetes bacterium]|nr:single-stranded-DNA-specific exonuclease RecJ [Gemmatimonadota bacterium]